MNSRVSMPFFTQICFKTMNQNWDKLSHHFDYLFNIVFIPKNNFTNVFTMPFCDHFI